MRAQFEDITRELLNASVDPDDLIFPRAATRVGPRYQVNVPALNEPTPPGTAFPLILDELQLIMRIEIEERGGESTIELLSNVVKMQEQKREKTSQSYVILIDISLS